LVAHQSFHESFVVDGPHPDGFGAAFQGPLVDVALVEGDEVDRADPHLRMVPLDDLCRFDEVRRHDDLLRGAAHQLELEALFLEVEMEADAIRECPQQLVERGIDAARRELVVGQDDHPAGIAPDVHLDEVSAGVQVAWVAVVRAYDHR